MNFPANVDIKDGVLIYKVPESDETLRLLTIQQVLMSDIAQEEDFKKYVLGEVKSPQIKLRGLMLNYMMSRFPALENVRVMYDSKRNGKFYTTKLWIENYINAVRGDFTSDNI